jgi:uncharacterized protein YqjF (DUF2071 family)
MYMAVERTRAGHRESLTRIARQTAHRPWPPPARPWLIAQTWRNLLFAHWPVSRLQLQPLIPTGLQLETYAGEAWVGVVPFHLSRIAPRGVPDRLGLGFPELNVRTYVTAENKPGIWFFSLDAARLSAVIGARLAYHLPYYWASMRIEVAGWIEFTSRRRVSPPGTAAFAARYWPRDPVFESAPGSLEDWLTARYCLYAADRNGRLFRAEINHLPWPLQPAEMDLTVNSMATAHGISLAGPPLLHFARCLDIVTWLPERLD